MAEVPAAPANTGQPATSGTAHIIAGGANGTGIRIASDLSRLLDGNGLRVIPIAGKGSVEDINDLLALQPADTAIVQSGVMAHALAQPRLPTQVKYVAKLYSEEFSELSRMQFLCLADLRARDEITASAGPSFRPPASPPKDHVRPVHWIFGQQSGSNKNPVPFDTVISSRALNGRRAGSGPEDSGSAIHALDGVTRKDKVHFPDVEYLQALQGNYPPAIITPEDYPNLVAPNESVAAIGVSYVPAIRDQPPQLERYRVMARFVEKFLSGFGQAQGSRLQPGMERGEFARSHQSLARIRTGGAMAFRGRWTCR